MIKPVKGVLLAVLFLWASDAIAAGGTYWVNKSASGQHCVNSASDPGAANSSLTIAQGVACLTSGDTLNIQQGTYAEQFSDALFPPSGSADSYNNATIVQGFGSGTVIIGSPSGGGGLGRCADAGPVKYIIFKNLHFGNSSNINGDSEVGGGHCNQAGELHHIKFDNVEWQNALQASGRGNLLLLEPPAHDIWITNSKLHGSSCGTFNNPGHLIYQGSSNALIEHTEIGGGVGWGIHQYGQTDDDHGGSIYRFNYIHDTGRTGTCAPEKAHAIIAGRGDNVQVYGNVIANNSNGIMIKTRNSVYYNNTIYGSFDTSGWAALYIDTPDWTGNVVKNNLLFNNAINTVEVHSPSNITSPNFTSDPSFVNAGAGNAQGFMLSSSSPAIDKADSLSSPYNVDYAGINRPQGNGWDFGAFEATTGTPVLPTITVVTPGANIVTTASTQTVTGTATCATGCDSVTWTNKVSGITVGSGTATGPPTSWTVGNIPLTTDKVNVLTFTIHEGSNAIDAILDVRANGTDRLVLAYKFNECSGTSLFDSSLNGNTGTWTGTGNAWNAAGKHSCSLSFNGGGGVSIPAASTLDVSTFTIEAWVNQTTASSNFTSIFASDYYSGGYIGLFATTQAYLCSGPAGVPGGGINEFNKWVCDSIELPLTNTWVHLALTYDATNLKFYRNGVLIRTVAATGLPMENTAIRRIAYSVFGEFFKGGLDDFRMYNVAIPATNGTGDACTDSIASINRDLSCEDPGITPMTVPKNLTIGSQSVTIGDKVITIGGE